MVQNERLQRLFVKRKSAAKMQHFLALLALDARIATGIFHAPSSPDRPPTVSVRARGWLLQFERAGWSTVTARR